jgi:hypothetical protein
MNCDLNVVSALCNLDSFNFIYFGVFTFSGLIFLHYLFTKCECGAYWHTKEERKSTLIQIVFLFVVSLIIGFFLKRGLF